MLKHEGMTSKEKISKYILSLWSSLFICWLLLKCWLIVMFMLLECISLGWKKKSLFKGKKRSSNQTILPPPCKKHRHTLKSLIISILMVSSFDNLHLKNQLCAIRTLLGQSDRQAIKGSPFAHLHTHIYMHTHIYTYLKSLSLLPVQWTLRNCQQCSMLELSRADYLRIYFSSSLMPYLLFKEVKLMV